MSPHGPQGTSDGGLMPCPPHLADLQQVAQASLLAFPLTATRLCVCCGHHPVGWPSLSPWLTSPELPVCRELSNKSNGARARPASSRRHATSLPLAILQMHLCPLPLSGIQVSTCIANLSNYYYRDFQVKKIISQPFRSFLSWSFLDHTLTTPHQLCASAHFRPAA